LEIWSWCLLSGSASNKRPKAFQREENKAIDGVIGCGTISVAVLKLKDHRVLAFLKVSGKTDCLDDIILPQIGRRWEIRHPKIPHGII
jgi:hypothetical protein